MSAAERQSQAHVVIVTPEAWGVTRENGGISTSVVHFARLFRGLGDRVTLLVGVAKDPQLDPDWADRYEREGIELVPAVAAQGVGRAPLRHGLDFPFRRISEAVADAVPADADIVYLQDWSALGFEYLRWRGPAVASPAATTVTVLRSSSKWLREGAERAPEDTLAEERLAFAERFATERSDFVVSPSETYRDWLLADGTRLPPDGRTRLLTHPWLPHDGAAPAPGQSALRFHRLVFFGRLETRKGLEIFLDALRRLAASRPDLLDAVHQIVFLGREGRHRESSLDSVAAEVRSFGADAVFSPDLDSWNVQTYLAESASDSLVVIPSLSENFPNAVVEASLVPGLNVIASDVGGVRTIFGPRGTEQLFAPDAVGLSDALERWLERGPRPASELGSYDWETANARWLAFHEELLDRSRSAGRAPRAPSARPWGLRPASPDGLSIVISTYEWPEALDAVLYGLSQQSDDRFDVVIADDGSGPETADVVGRWLEVFGERLVHVWQPDDGSRVAIARNRGALAARGDYLVFLDGDCIPRRHFVRVFRASTHPGWFAAGWRLQLSPSLTERILTDDADAHRWSLARWLAPRTRREVTGLRALTPRDRRRVGRGELPEYHPHNRAYGFLMGVKRSDFELVDGFDTRFVGWADEDVDLVTRLRRLGLRCGHAGPQATVLHLWHESQSDGFHANGSLLLETEGSDRIEAVEGLHALARAAVEPQLNANRVGASSSSSEPANR